MGVLHYHTINTGIYFSVINYTKDSRCEVRGLHGWYERFTSECVFFFFFSTTERVGAMPSARPCQAGVVGSAFIKAAANAFRFIYVCISLFSVTASLSMLWQQPQALVQKTT